MANASRLSTSVPSSPLLYRLLKGRAYSSLPCCFEHYQEAAAPVMVAAEAIKAPPVQPSRELAHVRYFVDGSVDAGVHRKLEELLNAYGASPCKLVSAAESSISDGMQTDEAELQDIKQQHVDLEDVTHIITMTMDYRDHKAVEARNAKVAAAAEANGKQSGTAPGATGRRGDLIAVVTPLWVTKTCDYRKRQDEQYFSPDPAKIFSGVTICTEGLVAGDSEAVKGIVSALGGQWRGPLVAEVTHLICLNLEGKKAQRLLGSGLRLGMKAVLPHWIDDCVKLHLRVPEDPYLFPDPPVFTSNQLSAPPYEQRLLNFFTNIGKQAPVVNNYSSPILDPHVVDGESQAATRGQMVSPAMSSSDPSKLVLTGKAVYVSSSCELSPEKLQTFMRKIKEAGGEPLASATIQENAVLLDRADIVVVNYREGWEFWKAYDAGKIIGNLDWLIYVLFSNPVENGAKLPSPTERLLHWPWPRAVARGFEDTNFTVSGYVGAARETLKRMIELLGGTFEGTLTKNKTTHLVASVQSGSKVTHASSWGIPVVNHLWMEDCFRQWQAVDVTKEKYINFEPSYIEGDLQEFAAGRAIDLKNVERWANTPEVQKEKQLSLNSVNDAIVDEMDEAEEEAELLSSPGPSDREGTPNNTADETLQDDPRCLRAVASDTDPGSSPLPSLRNVIPATQHPRRRSPSASENASEASALAHNLIGQSSKPVKKLAQRPSVSTPGVRKGARATHDPSLDSLSSSASDSEPKPEPADKKRKRASLAGLGDIDSGFDTSVGYTGRKAAQAATQKLRDTIMPDVIAYEKEKRGGGTKHLEEMFGGKAPNGSAKKPGSTSANGRANGRAATQSTSGSDREASPPAVSTNGRNIKRARRSSPPLAHASTASRAIKGRNTASTQARADSPEYVYMSEQKTKRKASSVSKVVLAGRKPHVASTGVAMTPEQRKALQKLGAKILGDNIDGCTHIVVKSISRTVKFLSAIPMGAYFVTEDWVHDSIEAGQLLDEDKYILKDKEGEAKHNMNLAKTLSQARRTKILDDHTFYVTANVQPSFEALKSIAESAGAKVIKRLPTVKQVSDRADVYIISSVAEKPSWEHLSAQGIPVYSGEAIIKAVMQQQRQFELYIIGETEDQSS